MSPYILFKGNTSWTEGGALFGQVGWKRLIFWIRLTAIQHLSPDPGVVLFVDGHHSHELAREKGVHLVCFPPHILQQLDASVYHPLKQSWATVLKQYKLESMAENVAKSVFPSLISKLWEHSFRPSHVTAGFRAAGLYPLAAQGKLATSIPFRAPTSDASSTIPSSACSTTSSTTSSSSATASSLSSGSDTLALQATGTLLIQGECTNCGAALTPMRPHLTLHFEKLLQKKNAAKGTNSRKRVKPKYYGESLTSNEVFERLQADKESHKRPSKKRRQSPPPAANKSEVESHDEGIIIYIYRVICSPVIFKIYMSA